MGKICECHVRSGRPVHEGHAFGFPLSRTDCVNKATHKALGKDYCQACFEHLQRTIDAQRNAIEKGSDYPVAR
jgi:hypothetical protein